MEPVFQVAESVQTGHGAGREEVWRAERRQYEAAARNADNIRQR